MQTIPMPTPDRYPPGLPPHLRAWHDALPVDDEPVTPSERAAIAAAKADPEPGCSSEELEARLANAD